MFAQLFILAEMAKMAQPSNAQPIPAITALGRCRVYSGKPGATQSNSIKGEGRETDADAISWEQA
jgi:hypothetical protein